MSALEAVFAAVFTIVLVFFVLVIGVISWAVLTDDNYSPPICREGYVMIESMCVRGYEP